MNSTTYRNCLYVTGFPPDTERRTIQNEFLKFGNIKKLYIDKFENYAKVFYFDKKSCDLALQGLNNTSLNWQVRYFDKYSSTTETTPHWSSLSRSSSEATKMAGYNNYYDEDEFSENFDYCNIHGQPLVVLQADSGDLYVNLKDIRKTGFVLFRRENFSSVLVDKKQIAKEFELHLLSEAQNYIIKNQVAIIDEDQILKTIERCKNKLLGGNVKQEPQNTFGSGRTVQPAGSSNFVITSEAHSTPNARYPKDENVNQRPPKSLDNRFGPNHNNDSAGCKPKGQEHMMNQSRGGGEPHSNIDVEFHKERNHKFSNTNTNQREKNVEFVESTSNRSERTEISLSEKHDMNQKSANLNDSTSSESSNRTISKRTNKSFEIGHSYDVHIAFTDEEKDNICWVQEQKNISIIEDMFLKVNEMEGDLEIVDPVPGQRVIALYDGVWNRARIITTDPLKVHFIDYGNKSEVDTVKSLPDDLKRVPGMAIRVAINKFKNLNLENKTEVTIIVKHQYEGGTYLVDIVDDDNENTKIDKVIKASVSVESLELQAEPVAPPRDTSIQKAYFDIPKPMAHLHDGDRVMIVDVDGNKLLVKTKQCAQRSKEITEYIKELDKSDLMLTNVKVGQIVLCSKDGLAGLYRAVIAKKDNASFVTVKYLDFSGEDDLSVKSLRNIDNYLATAPCSILLTPPIEGLDITDEEILNYVATLCINREKCAVVLSKDNFDIKFTDGKLLSEKLLEIKKSKSKKESSGPPVLEEAKPGVQEEIKPPVQEKSTPPVQEESKPSAQDGHKLSIPEETKPQNVEKEPAAYKRCGYSRVMFDDMHWIKIEPGTHIGVCYSIEGIDNLIMIFSDGELLEHLSTITSYVSRDNKRYKPKLSEMCFVEFQGPYEEEGSWYRAVVLKINQNDYVVKFVDFGNQETVEPWSIRKMPPALRYVPMLGSICECSGIPNTPEILKRMKELIPEGADIDVVVKGLNDSKYMIEMPNIYEKLKSENLY